MAELYSTVPMADWLTGLVLNGAMFLGVGDRECHVSK